MSENSVIAEPFESGEDISDSESDNDKVKRTSKPKRFIEDSEKVVVLKKVVSKEKIRKDKIEEEKNLLRKAKTKKRVGVEKKVKVKKKSQKRVDFKNFSPSEIIER